MDMPHTNRKAREPVNLISSTHTQHSPQYSPDCERVVFCSNRSGAPEIWVSGSDASNPVQLTSLGATVTGSPRWSPDGQRIVFDSNVEGQYEIYVIDASGGRPQRLTTHPATDAMASYSRDGRRIYFASNRTGRTEIWKIPAEGGQPVQVTRNGGYVAFESSDGMFIYFAKNQFASSLYKIPVGGDSETVVLKSMIGNAFAVANKRIYFEQLNRGGPTSIQFLNLATGNIGAIATIRPNASWGMSVSPDEHELLYAQFDHTGSDLMLVENFR